MSKAGGRGGEALALGNTTISRSNADQTGAENAPVSAPWTPRPYIPKSVKACEKQAWHLACQNTATGELKNFCYRCFSWRHQGECRDYAGRLLFARVRDALAPYKPEQIVLMVFTLNQRRWSSHDAAYRKLVKLWTLMRQNITRTWGKPIGFVSTVEMHSSGFPHLNVVMVHPVLAAAIGASEREGGKASREYQLGRREELEGQVDDGRKGKRILVSGEGRATLRELRALSVKSHFGWNTQAFQLSGKSSRDAVAGYITKTANRAIGEIVKPGQLPVNAPPKFRRHRELDSLSPSHQEKW